MGWLDKVKKGMGRAAEEIKGGVGRAADEAGDMAAIARLRLDLRTLNGKMSEALEAIGGKAYDLHEAGTKLPAEVATLCEAADKIADEIKSKEAEVDKIRKS
jgi:hypothetical protein